MNLHKLIFTENACYKAGEKITPKGIMVHSTGANNPWLKRYVGPDDGLLGVNKYNNHWNQPMDRNVCVHAFIGKLADGTVATYQALPWDHRGWHSGSGKNGSANDSHIGFEICEDDLADAAYFDHVYREAVALCAYLCKEFSLDPAAAGVIIDHAEGWAKGIASDHGDVGYWFKKHGKSMAVFRNDVAAAIPKEKDYSRKIFLQELQTIIGATQTGRADLETLGKTTTIGAKFNRAHACVKPVQKRLLELGYSEVGEADGVAGTKFTSAVAHFQQDHGITPTGVMEEWGRTWAELLTAGNGEA